jgi:hypothetical protein
LVSILDAKNSGWVFACRRSSGKPQKEREEHAKTQPAFRINKEQLYGRNA